MDIFPTSYYMHLQYSIASTSLLYICYAYLGIIVSGRRTNGSELSNHNPIHRPSHYQVQSSYRQPGITVGQKQSFHVHIIAAEILLDLL